MKAWPGRHKNNAARHQGRKNWDKSHGDGEWVLLRGLEAGIPTHW